jgi:hypothetical protein
LNNLDSVQWRRVFEPQVTISKIMPFIYSSSKAPSIVKAAAIKMLGYMVYFDISSILQNPEEEKKFKNTIYQLVFEFAGDSNINVQMRNSWTLANLNFVNKVQL